MGDFVPCGRPFDVLSASPCRYGRMCPHCRHIATLERIMGEAGIAVMDDGEWFFGDPVPPASELVEVVPESTDSGDG